MTAPIRSQAELLDAIRARRDELNISHETIDNIAGFQAGYTSKLLCDPPMKNPGSMSLGALLGALGMALMPVPDPGMIAKVQDRWQKRKRPQRLTPASMSASMSASIQNEVPAEIQITPELQAKLGKLEHMKRIAKLGGKRRAKLLGKRARQQIATHAARKRWARRLNVAATPV